MNYRGANSLRSFKIGSNILFNTVLDVPPINYLSTGGSGLQGPQGLQGTGAGGGGYGYQGPTGPSGGPIGPQGYTGVQGYQGIQGVTGARGFQGLVGLTGIQGSTGPSNPGVQGFQGFTGMQGMMGIQGSTGPSNPGVQGFQGHTGLQGYQGFQGHTGLQGYQGFQGHTGLQGYQGYQGYQGHTGLQGYQGYQGHTGLQGYQGYQGHTGLQGLQGYQGHTGLQGYQGYQGHTGLQGYQGYQGSTGMQGYQGLIGYQGSTGMQGLAGIQGATGPSNPGVQGLMGITGAQGIMGIQGSTGSAGIQGSGFNTIANFGNNRILISTGTSNNSAIAYNNLTYDGTTLNAPTFTGSNFYASTQHLGNSSDSVSAPSFSWIGDTNCGLYHPTTDNIGIVTNGSERVRIDNGGNVGIGTASPGYKLDVLGGSARIGDSTSSPSYLLNLGSTGNVGGSSNYRAGYIYGDGSNMFISNQQGGRLELSTDNVAYIKMFTGTTYVLNPLFNDIDKNDTFVTILKNRGSSLGYGLLIDYNNTAYALGIRDRNGVYQHRFGGDGTVAIGMSGVAFNVTSEGNIGINTAYPSAKFDVYNGNMFISGPVGRQPYLKFSSYSGANSQFPYLILNKVAAWYSLYALNRSGNDGIGFGPSDTNGLVTTPTLVMLDSGNVGIGTQTPTQKLHVVGGRARIDSVLELGASSYTSYIFTETNGDLKIYPNTSSQNLILNPSGLGGNVGIGTTTPNSNWKLDVNGNIGVTDGYSFCLRKNATVTDGGTYSIGLSSDLLNMRFVGNQDSSTNRLFDFGYYSGDSKTNTWNSKVVINSYNGKVGIGTTTPVGLLSVNMGDNTSNYGGMGSWDNTYAVFGQADNTSGGALGIGYNSANLSCNILSLSPSVAWRRLNISALTHVWTIEGTIKMVLDQSGNLVLGGNLSSSYQLELSSDDAYKLNTSTWYHGSDSRVKLNIQDADLDICYNTIKNLPLRRFTWDPYYYPEINDRNSVGFIAQEVEQVFPKAVKTFNKKFTPYTGTNGEIVSPDEIVDFKSLDVDQLNKTLFGTVKKCIQKIETLEEQLTTEKNKVNTLINLLKTISPSNEFTSSLDALLN